MYTNYREWARWFWKGAVHIDDVAAAVILSLDLISRQRLTQQLILALDSAYEYTHADLDHWDAEGAGSTFKKYYPEYYDLALSYGFDPALKPTRLDISETARWLGYKPSYSLASLLSELAAYGPIADRRSLPRRKMGHVPAQNELVPGCSSSHSRSVSEIRSPLPRSICRVGERLRSLHSLCEHGRASVRFIRVNTMLGRRKEIDHAHFRIETKGHSANSVRQVYDAQSRHS